jgi:hypothetical protein
MDRPFNSYKNIGLFLGIFVLGLIYSPCIARAQDEPSTEAPITKKKSSKGKSKKKSKKKKPAAELEKPVAERPAEEHKTFEVLLNAGLAPNPLLGVGGTVGFFLGDGSSAIEASVLASQKKFPIVAMTSTVFGARYRKSFFGIPYIAIGAGMRSLTAKWNTLSIDETEEFASGASSSSIILDSAIGGQMILGHFVLGADIIGVMYPVSKGAVKETTPAEGSYSVSDYQTQLDVFNGQNGMNLVIFRAGIGVAF